MKDLLKYLLFSQGQNTATDPQVSASTEVKSVFVCHGKDERSRFLPKSFFHNLSLSLLYHMPRPSARAILGGSYARRHGAD